MSEAAARPVVTVVGAGPGGLSVAGRSALRGCETRLYDIDDEALRPLRERGAIDVQGVEQGIAPIAGATTNAALAIPPADLIIVCVPGDLLDSVADGIGSHLRDGQVVLITPGCTAGALQLRAACRDVASRAIVFAETDAFAFGCSIPVPGAVKISVVKRSFGLAALPAALTGRALEVVRNVFPEARAVGSVLETGLSNMNAVLHIAPMIANAGRIEFAGESFDFYGEGVTPAVARLMAAHDHERLAVASALSVEVPSLLEWIGTTYGVRSEDLFDAIGQLSRDVYGAVPAPDTLEHRYLTEDVPCGAIPVAQLGDRLSVDVSATEQSVTVASSLLGRDLRDHGRTLDRLGLAGLGVDEIRRTVGLKPSVPFYSSS